MNKPLYDKWIDALETGSYKPAKNTLRIDDKFCCLGVLCDIVDPNNWELTKHHIHHIIGSYNNKKNELSSEISNLIGLNSYDGSFMLEDLSINLQIELINKTHNIRSVTSLAFINDNIKNEKNAFPLIAKVLKEKPKSLMRNA